eukprot:c510_g1_i1.p1 GENE.c510_g1_i1~~c510_g1_i1.p1  ORF type:complete len:285 (-),score=41.79 c510_g1_i1:7-861(-)
MSVAVFATQQNSPRRYVREQTEEEISDTLATMPYQEGHISLPLVVSTIAKLETPSRQNILSDRQTLCIICFEQTRNTRLACGHSTMCQKCCEAVLSTSGQCPNCRERFSTCYVNERFSKESVYVIPSKVDWQSCQMFRFSQVTIPPTMESILSPPPLYTVYSREMLWRLIAVVCLICILQGLLFMNCYQKQACLCGLTSFEDGHSCADMCSCIQHTCSNITTTCNKVDNWNARKSPLCWETSSTLTCRWNASAVIVLVGLSVSIVLLVVCCRKMYLRRVLPAPQ